MSLRLGIGAHVVVTCEPQPAKRTLMVSRQETTRKGTNTWGIDLSGQAVLVSGHFLHAFVRVHRRKCYATNVNRRVQAWVSSHESADHHCEGSHSHHPRAGLTRLAAYIEDTYTTREHFVCRNVYAPLTSPSLLQSQRHVQESQRLCCSRSTGRCPAT